MEMVKVTQVGDVRVFTLTDAVRRNPLSVPMQTELAAAIASVRDNTDVRCVLLTGEGPAFSAGGDLVDMGTLTPALVKRFMAGSQAIVRSLAELPMPVVIAVNGAAAGAGFSLAMAGDILIAAHGAKFISGFARIGAVPDLGLAQTLARSIGLHRTLELLLSGRVIDADEAKQLGLVARVVPADALMDEALAEAQKLARGPTVALGLTKALIRVAATEALAAYLNTEASAQALAFTTDDFAEGLAAFREGRAALFGGR